MKRLALTAAALSLALAAPALAAPSTAPAAQHHAKMAAASQSPASHEGQRMTTALNTLEANGYGDFSNFKADGTNFSATVTQNGKQMTVVINPDTGQVTKQG